MVLVRKEIQILSHATITPMGLAASLAFTEERFPIVSNGRTVICLSRQTAATSTCMSMNESEKDVAFIVRRWLAHHALNDMNRVEPGNTAKQEFRTLNERGNDSRRRDPIEACTCNDRTDKLWLTKNLGTIGS